VRTHGDLLVIILRDEIEHVAAGTRWFRQICAARGLEPEAEYFRLLDQFLRGELRCPSTGGTARGGFSESELIDCSRCATSADVELIVGLPLRLSPTTGIALLYASTLSLPPSRTRTVPRVVPLGEHDALRGLAVEGDGMDRRTMGVAMNQPPHAVRRMACATASAFTSMMSSASARSPRRCAPVLGRQGGARRHGLPRKSATKAGCGASPVLVVVDVIGAQQIAVREQGRSAVEIDDGEVRQQLSRRLAGEAHRPESPVTALEEQGDAVAVSSRRAPRTATASALSSSSPIQASNRSPRMYSTSACRARSRETAGRARSPAVARGEVAGPR